MYRFGTLATSPPPCTVYICTVYISTYVVLDIQYIHTIHTQCVHTPVRRNERCRVCALTVSLDRDRRPPACARTYARFGTGPRLGTRARTHARRRWRAVVVVWRGALFVDGVARIHHGAEGDASVGVASLSLSVKNDLVCGMYVHDEQCDKQPSSTRCSSYYTVGVSV